MEVFREPLEFKVAIGRRNDKILEKETRSISAETIKTPHFAMLFGQRDMYDKVIVLSQNDCLKTDCSTCPTFSLCTVSSLEYRSKIDKGGVDKEAAPTSISRESEKSKENQECLPFWRYSQTLLRLEHRGKVKRRRTNP